MDFSTINLDILTKLQTWEAPASNRSGTWDVQRHPGCGCHLDAPGFPSYFLRHIYKGGDGPSKGPTMVIRVPGVDLGATNYVTPTDYVVATANSDYDELKPLLTKLWVPLPYEHERVQLWVRAVYAYMAHCYEDEARSVVTDRYDSTFIFPVPAYKLKRFVDDERFSEDWRDKAKAEVEAYNADIVARSKKLATPQNHRAFRWVQRFYPHATPELAHIATPPDTQGEGWWWETEATKPTIETCKPRNNIGGNHTDPKGWCQWCGWAGEESNHAADADNVEKEV